MTTGVDSSCTFETSRIGAGFAIEVTGILDWHSAPRLRAALSDLGAAAGMRRVLIDLTEVTRIDSSGTGELIAAAVRSGRTGVQMAIVTGHATAEILENVGIGDYVLVFSDRASAYTWGAGERSGYPLGR